MEEVTKVLFPVDSQAFPFYDSYKRTGYLTGNENGYNGLL